jgi:hypothetical protein
MEYQKAFIELITIDARSSCLQMEFEESQRSSTRATSIGTSGISGGQELQLRYLNLYSDSLGAWRPRNYG